ncbi:hypothetical protein [Listeria sp. PSOL-1]|uniref:hypothetical protein n=1 Tax=Listeria sp. PSOL-1 TaxID=1844999 RepID=UPI0013D12112|nr:hypothetical protein [Listeria sp. PSOL-1]
MNSYFFEKPKHFRKNQPITILDEQSEPVGEIIKQASGIIFSKNNNIFSSQTKDLATVTLEIGWLGRDGASVIYHDKENHQHIIFEEISDHQNSRHITTKATDFPIDFIQKAPDDEYLLFFHNRKSASLHQFLNTEGKTFIKIDIFDENTNVPDSLFFLLYFIQKLFKTEF